MKTFPLWTLALLAAFGTACEEEQPPPQYPPQPYPQQYPPQPYPQPYPQPMPAPATAPVPAPAPAPAPGTSTSIPGVEKKADGTCWITPPPFGNQPSQPVQVPCPP
jgi:hypothetical protein